MAEPIYTNRSGLISQMQAETNPPVSPSASFLPRKQHLCNEHLHPTPLSPTLRAIIAMATPSHIKKFFIFLCISLICYRGVNISSCGEISLSIEEKKSSRLFFIISLIIEGGKMKDFLMICMPCITLGHVPYYRRK